MDLKLQDVGYFSSIFKQIYTDIENIDVNIVNAIPVEFDDYLSVLWKHAGKPINFANKDLHVKQFDIPTSNKILIGFTGGKDSTATVIKVIQAGYEPILFHVRGINRVWPNEYIYARQLAVYLGLPLVEATVSIKGKTYYKENPAKNQLILALMVDYGIEHGIHHYTLGSDMTEALERANIMFDFSDAIEIYGMVASIYKKSISNFKYHTLVADQTDSYKTIFDHDPKIYDIICSCMLPYRYQGNIRKKNVIKFPKVYFNERACGSCYKCCYEYMHLVLLGHYEPDIDYLKHCMRVLWKHARTIKLEEPTDDLDVLCRYLNNSILPITKIAEALGIKYD